MSHVIEELDAAGAETAIPSLSQLLIDVVEGGASVGFMLPISLKTAERFWAKVAGGVGRGEINLLVARCGEELVGTVQLHTSFPENQPHRGEVAKLQVLRSARRQGIAEDLMVEVERIAARERKTLLVLDTASDAAEALYRKLGWQLCGVIPDYALLPSGALCQTTVFYKQLAPPGTS